MDSNSLMSPIWHPSLDQLVLYTDGQLGGWQHHRFRRHIEACWQCRRLCARLAEGAGVFIDLCENAMGSMGAPKPKLGAFRRRMNTAFGADACEPKSFRALTARMPRATWMGLVLATAAALALVMLPVTDPSTLGATEILVRSEQSSRRESAPMRHRITLRSPIHTTTVEVAAGRWVGAVADGPQDEFRQVFARIPVDWSDPLNPSRFRQWRTGLRFSTDTVLWERERVTITTTPSKGGFIKTGSFTIQRADYHPLKEVFELANAKVLEIEEVAAARESSATGTVGVLKQTSSIIHNWSWQAERGLVRARNGDRGLGIPTPRTLPGRLLI